MIALWLKVSRHLLECSCQEAVWASSADVKGEEILGRHSRSLKVPPVCLCLCLSARARLCAGGVGVRGWAAMCVSIGRSALQSTRVQREKHWLCGLCALCRHHIGSHLK